MLRPTRMYTALAIIISMALCATAGQPKKKSFLDPKKAGPDFQVQGEYEGKTSTGSKFGVQVVALGESKFDAVVYPGGLPGAGSDGKTKIRLKGESTDGVTELSGKNFGAKIADGRFSGIGEDNIKYKAEKVVRKSPTLGAKPPTGAIVLFDGSSAEGWEKGKIVKDPVTGESLLDNGPWFKSPSPRDFTLHLEFRAPLMPFGRGQGRGNSGMYLSGQYECQVLDSFGLEGTSNECGGIYGVSEPKVNMCLPPLSWQTYDVEFNSAKFDENDKKTANAVVTIRHNGVVIHEKLELQKASPAGKRDDEKPGPLYLQNHGNPVLFRNIWMVEK